MLIYKIKIVIISLFTKELFLMFSTDNKSA